VKGWIALHAGDAAGYALSYPTFSSFRTRPSVWLEDLFVREEARGTGLGRDLFATVARDALRNQAYRLEWAVLDWNEPAIRFYEARGARAEGRVQDWIQYALEGEPLARLAAAAPGES
jgi:GNAT superfamily N-acetyltransferase